MNVLEKILEEIKTLFDENTENIEDLEGTHHFVIDSFTARYIADKAICSHMNKTEKVSSAEIISHEIDGKPYYEIKYKEVGSGEYHIGYGSYDLNNVVKWLNECFEFCGEAKIVVNAGKDINAPSNGGWIDRKNLKEEIESLRFAITGMRNGKTMTNLALEEYRKSILRIIDEQPTYMDDGWIPVEERLPEEKINPITKDFYVYPVTFELDGVRDIRYYPFGMGHWWKATEIMDEYVKAWMPIPEPYRPKEKNNE